MRPWVVLSNTRASWHRLVDRMNFPWSITFMLPKWMDFRVGVWTDGVLCSWGTVHFTLHSMRALGTNATRFTIGIFVGLAGSIIGHEFLALCSEIFLAWSEIITVVNGEG